MHCSSLAHGITNCCVIAMKLEWDCKRDAVGEKVAQIDVASMAPVPQGMVSWTPPFSWWIVQHHPGSSSTQLMDMVRGENMGTGGQWLPPSVLPQKKCLKFTFSTCFESYSYRSFSCRLMVTVSVPIGKEAWVETRKLFNEQLLKL